MILLKLKSRNFIILSLSEAFSVGRMRWFFQSFSRRQWVGPWHFYASRIFVLGSKMTKIYQFFCSFYRDDYYQQSIFFENQNQLTGTLSDPNLFRDCFFNSSSSGFPLLIVSWISGIKLPRLYQCKKISFFGPDNTCSDIACFVFLVIYFFS